MAHKQTSFLKGLIISATIIAMAPLAYAGPYGNTLQGSFIESTTNSNYSAAQQDYLLNINKTEIVRLPVNASAIVVGNPDIADISVHAADTIFVIGRNFGETNLVVLDERGQLLLDATLQVTAKLPSNGVRLHYGNNQRETYHCAPYCVGAPTLGDLADFTSLNSNSSGAADSSSNAVAFGGTGGATGGGGSSSFGGS